MMKQETLMKPVTVLIALIAVDKQLIIVPGAGHALTVQKPRLRFYSEVAKWFSVE